MNDDLIHRLRAAADREWRVPVSESVALMLEAADALAAADLDEASDTPW